MSQSKYRLVTRSDFDGLVCAVLLKELGMLDDIQFAHPKEMQERSLEITERDIITNLPYVPGCHLVFDHHSSEMKRCGEIAENHVIDPTAPSAARVVYDYFGGRRRFPNVSEDMMEAVDRADSAQFTVKEILEPQGWILLSFLMDPRTGLGRFRDFRISNYQLMMQLIDMCRDRTIDQILMQMDVAERVDLYQQQRDRAKEQINRCSKVYGNVVVLNLKDEDKIHVTNRFTVYALYPQCNISIHVIPGKQGLNTVFALGASIINRTSKTNIGELCLQYGGGGHHNAGTCQVEHDVAAQVEAELIQRMHADQDAAGKPATLESTLTSA